MKRVPNLDEDTIFIHICEELGEVARQLINRKIGHRRFDESNLKEEISQVILDLFVLAEMFNMNLEESLREKIREIRKRKDLNSNT